MYVCMYVCMYIIYIYIYVYVYIYIYICIYASVFVCGVHVVADWLRENVVYMKKQSAQAQGRRNNMWYLGTLGPRCVCLVYREYA
jgi:hypothetical protein